MVTRIKKNDTVVVLSGKDKGKQGPVIALKPKKGEVLIKGIAVATRHAKARRAGETAGIKKEERFIPISIVMPICTSCKKPCRINAKKLENGKNVRMCNRCKEIF